MSFNRRLRQNILFPSFKKVEFNCWGSAPNKHAVCFASSVNVLTYGELQDTQKQFNVDEVTCDLTAGSPLTTVNFMPTEMSKKLYFLVEYLCRSLHGT
jgi:hypothetical protein